jgi:nucleoside-diphosphate-sugar epimerase
MAASVVLGGAGFLGSHLCEALLSDHRQVIAIDDLSSGKISNFTNFSANSKFTFLEQNICLPIDLEQNIDYVFNFASPASPPHYLNHPIHTLQTGSIGTQNAIELALRKNARLIQASTSEVYGDPTEHPQRESYWGNVNPIGDRSCYDEAKRYSEALCMAYKRTRGLNLGIVRIFNTYGPRLDVHDGRVVSNFVNQALRNDPITIYGSGQQTRSFCYVSDLVNGILKLAITGDSVVGPINIGNPNEFTVFELAQLVIEKTQSKSEIIFKDLPSDDPQRRCPDISLAKESLDWQPEVPLEVGIQYVIDWYKSQGVTS